MRTSFFLLLLSAGMANAVECTAPKQQGDAIIGLEKFAACLNKAMTNLETENTRLKDEIEKLEDRLDDFPGTIANTDGRVTRTGGKQLIQATFTTVVRRRETAQSLPIEQDAVEAMCASGCTVQMFLTAEGIRNSDPSPVFASGTCTFRYSAKDGAWSQDGGCGDATSGVDGDGKPPSTPGGDVIGVVGGACMLADAQAGRSVGAGDALIGQDRTKGLFLVSDPSLWRGETDRFRCEVKFSR